MNTDVEGRLAVGGNATLMNFGTASAHASENGGKGAAFALVSNTFLTYTNGQIHGDLHYNDNAVSLTSVGVSGTRYANSTPINFAAASTSLIDQSQFLATQAATGTVSVSGTTITLTGSLANSLNVFTLSSSQLAAATFGRLNITNVASTATVLINVSGAMVSMQYMDFQYGGVGGDQPFAHQVLYNLYQATSLTVNGASPLGSILAPMAAVTGGTSGGHISGTLIAGSLSGMLEGHEYLFQGDLPFQRRQTTVQTSIYNENKLPVSGPVPLGTLVFDTATIGNQVSGVPATGTVTYQFFTTIDGTGPHSDEVVALNPDGSVPDSSLHGPLAAGSYSFVAVYSGDSNYLGSTSPVEPLRAQRVASAAITEITDVNHVAIPFPYDVPLGTSVHDAAAILNQVSGVPATGTVTYQFFTTIDGTGPHSDEVVNLNPDGTVPASALHGPLAAGTYSFIAVYSGDGNYAGSTSAVEPLTVPPASPALVTQITYTNHVAIPFPYEVPLGTSVRDSATIVEQHPGVPATGTVTYQFFTSIDGTGPHSDQTVTLNPDGSVPASSLHGPLAARAYSFIAVYGGDSNYAGSTSPVEPLTVQRGTSTSATVIVDENHTPITSAVPLGTTVRDTATVAGTPTAFTPTGTVTYLFFTTIDGTGPHSDQTVTLNPDGSVPDSSLHGPLAAGAYSFIAVYSGDTNYTGSTSPVEPLTVRQGATTTSTVIVEARGVPVTSPVPLGTVVYDTASVSGQVSSLAATGTVTYRFFTTIDGTGPHTDEVVTLNPDGSVPDSSLHGPLAAGAYSFIAVYGGDRNYTGSTSPVEPLTVQQGPSAAPTVVSLQRFGFHKLPTRFVLTSSTALDPARAQDPGNYTLTPIGPKGHVGKRIRIVSADYSAAASTVTLHPAIRVYLFAHYKLVVNGTPPLGLASPSGVLLDGRGKGVPGSDYVRIFGPSILASPHPPFPGATRSHTSHSKSARTHSSVGEP